MKTLSLFKRLLILIGVGLIAIPEHSRPALQDIGKELGFPFQILFEDLKCGIGPCTWRAAIEIPRAHYSRENLDQLFRFYSLLHPDMRERLVVKLYVRELNQFTATLSDEKQTVQRKVQAESELGRPDSTFDRAGDGAAPFGGRNEFYTYRNLDKPDEETLVILKGTLIFRSKKILESWKTSRGGTTIRVLAYYLEGVDPPGIYYTFQSFSPKWNEWKSIMTFRQDQCVPIPRDSVVFVSDTTAFLSMGSMYAVTSDAGNTWSAWDAERDFTQGRWSDHWTILQAEIAAGGNGTMRLSSSSESNPGTTLHTSDFGRHWYSDK